MILLTFFVIINASNQVVCSTAGLCNNAAIDKLLEEHEAQKSFNCEKCNNIGSVISQKFHTSSRDQVLDGFLAACGRLSSFSDACMSLVLTNFNEMYMEMSKNLETDKICHMSGVCSAKFHQHKPAQVNEIEIKTKSNVGFVKPLDDMPCELCEQLVKHLRDILVANTTENEFKTVLEGLCKQTKTFAAECTSLVDQYYPIIYESLVNNLDANGACFMIGVCPKGIPLVVPHMPLLPIQTKIPPRKMLGADEKYYTNDMIKKMVLPIDQLMGAKSSSNLVEGGKFCTLCHYFLHFLQEEISNAKTEDEIKQEVGKTCDKFPESIRPNCHAFINLYGDAIIAMLVQEIDPRDLCPTLQLCPKVSEDVDVFAPSPIDVDINAGNNPKCPLCVLVIKEAQEYLESSKSKESAKRALKKVCSSLPPKLQLQCTDFVDTYYDELLEKLVGNFRPMDICEDIKLCSNLTDDDIIRVGIEKVDYIPHVDIDTNEIPDFTINGRSFNEIEDSGECMLCVEVIGGAEHKITKGMTVQEVEQVLLGECKRFRAYEGVCDNFVKKNADEIADLVTKELAPKQICQKLSLCAVADQDLEIDEAIIVNVVAIPAFAPDKSFGRVTLTKSEPPKAIYDDPTCVLCEFIMTKLEQELKDKTTQDEIKTAVMNICSKLPGSVSKQCSKFVDQYAELIITLIDTVPPKQICQQMSLCVTVKKPFLVGDSECTWGPSHFCSDKQIADKCKV